MEKIFTLAELVEEYGTEVQKESFENNGNLNRRSFDSIIKRVEQDWESVKEEGRGSKRKIKCSGKLEDKAMKKDGRVRSGRQQVEHRIPMDVIVATHLEYDMTKQASMSLGKWAVEFGLITELEYDLLRSRHSSKLRQKHIDKAIQSGILEEDQTKLLDEFTQHCLEIIELSKIEGLEELDNAFEEFYSTDKEFELMKKDILENKYVEEWKELLEQCFENYENDKYLISIPSLLVVIEYLAHMFISLRIQKYITSHKGRRKPPLREQYTTVKHELEQDRTYIIIYVSVMEFLHEVFRAGNFDKNTTRFPIINRDWVLHGRDNPSHWNKVDALRLFHAIHSILELDFLLEESENDIV